MAMDDDPLSPPGPTPSPCVRLCTLNDADICVGCFRSLDEIKDWGGLDDPGRRAVLAAAARRRAATGTPRRDWMRVTRRG